MVLLLPSFFFIIYELRLEMFRYVKSLNLRSFFNVLIGYTTAAAAACVKVLPDNVENKLFLKQNLREIVCTTSLPSPKGSHHQTLIKNTMSTLIRTLIPTIQMLRNY